MFNGSVSWVFVFIAIALVVFVGGGSGGRMFRRDLVLLREFADEIGGTLRSGEGKGLDGCLIKGTLDGRPVTLQFGACTSGSRYVIQFGVAVDPSVSVSIKDPSLLARWFGRGKPQGGRFLVKSQDASETSNMFVHGGPELVDLLGELLEQGQTDEIVADGGWLYLQCELGSLNDRWFRWYFARMVKLARFYERRPILVRSRPRFLWTGGGEHALCPYCRDGLPDDLEAAVACDVCNTLHHDECFQEHGGCTIFGCEGRRRAVTA